MSGYYLTSYLKNVPFNFLFYFFYFSFLTNNCKNNIFSLFYNSKCKAISFLFLQFEVQNILWQKLQSSNSPICAFSFRCANIITLEFVHWCDYLFAFKFNKKYSVKTIRFSFELKYHLYFSLEFSATIHFIINFQLLLLILQELFSENIHMLSFFLSAFM